ncbi:hypothetical protein B0H17DRAFT_1150380 [Mycena rosella]|uniref:Uncharacterized protein n=1 Tax=Mycena rosella TaxID=1033263 RepID=A0AAD7FKK0_MYCRO|nr:hypothetical protein B0H17DRAFT_1150380 [Mycena rosella]
MEPLLGAGLTAVNWILTWFGCLAVVTFGSMEGNVGYAHVCSTDRAQRSPRGHGPNIEIGRESLKLLAILITDIEAYISGIEQGTSGRGAAGVAAASTGSKDIAGFASWSRIAEGSTGPSQGLARPPLSASVAVWRTIVAVRRTHTALSSAETPTSIFMGGHHLAKAAPAQYAPLNAAPRYIVPSAHCKPSFFRLVPIFSSYSALCFVFNRLVLALPIFAAPVSNDQLQDESVPYPH